MIEQSRPRGEPAIPEKLDVITGFRGTTFRRKWLGWHIIPVAIFCVIWNSFLFSFYSSLLSSEKINWLVILFPTGHLLAGVAMTYYVIATIFNRTDVSASPEGICVKSYPIFWGRERRIAAEDVVDTRVKLSQHNDRGGFSFGILYTTRENREKPIVRRGLTDDQAIYINFQLRKIIGLSNEEDH